jgi:uncharacterized protein
MKLANSFSIVVIILFCSARCALTNGQVVTLLRGAAYSEAEAKEKLDRLAAGYSDQASWEQRAKLIRAGVLHGMQLDHMPPSCELKPIRRNLRQMDGYTVENVAFESLPGYWVTGNLYLPTHIVGKIPGILNPHGHWPNGRFRDEMQLRCAMFARMGAAAFAWDMVGFGESTPGDHRRFQVLRMQTYNSMRSVDFLLSLGIVDETRLAVTGASGGGTQSFMLAAVDDRIDVSIPVVQVSAHFFGGCECESAMPIHKTAEYETNNVEIAALAAPRPMLLISDGADWTKNTPMVEFPHIQRIYSFYGKEQDVENAHFANEQHDYGPSKRAAAYRFLAKHFNLSLAAIENSAGNIDEDYVTILPMDQLCVFTIDNSRPEYAKTNFEDVLKLLNKTR